MFNFLVRGVFFGKSFIVFFIGIVFFVKVDLFIWRLCIFNSFRFVGILFFEVREIMLLMIKFWEGICRFCLFFNIVVFVVIVLVKEAIVFFVFVFWM